MNKAVIAIIVIVILLGGAYVGYKVMRRSQTAPAMKTVKTMSPTPSIAMNASESGEMMMASGSAMKGATKEITVTASSYKFDPSTITVKKGDTVKIFNTPFSQYAKFEGEARFYHKLGLKSNWVSRIDIGLGLPYGNSTQLPYVKQFFVGGSNSLRGFRSCGVGPGVYVPQDTSNVIPDQTGDIKFEINTEFRPHISGPLYGAIFLEAGNIWLVNDSTYTHKPGSQFTSKWLSQLAVDAGLGLRFDITVFVIRLDVGFPLRKPWLQNPWVINQIKLGDTHWRKNNLVYSLAIGYPF